MLFFFQDTRGKKGKKGGKKVIKPDKRKPIEKDVKQKQEKPKEKKTQKDETENEEQKKAVCFISYINAHAQIWVARLFGLL